MKPFLVSFEQVDLLPSFVSETFIYYAENIQFIWKHPYFIQDVQISETNTIIATTLS